MKILVPGGSGCIGRALCLELADRGHDVTVLSRNPAYEPPAEECKVYTYDHMPPEHFEVCINLAGANLGAKRLTKTRRELILSSRLKVIEKLKSQFARYGKPDCFMQASACGLYTDSALEQTEESSSFNVNFPGNVSLKLEQTAAGLGIRTLMLRIGMVLSPDGGLCEKLSMLPPLSLRQGGNYLPWIELNDCVSAIVFLLEHHQLQGVVNLCSPEYLTLKTIIDKINTAKLPLRIPVWDWMLKLDKRSCLMLADAKIKPQKLLKAGFTFKCAASDLNLKLKPDL